MSHVLIKFISSTVIIIGESFRIYIAVIVAVCPNNFPAS